MDLLGPDGVVRAVLSRPAEPNNPAAADSFFDNCVGGAPGTGTPIPAHWLNRVTALLRSVVRLSGLADSNTDDYLLARAGQQGFNYAADSGTADALVVALSPAPISYRAGLIVRVKKTATANATTTPTINVNSLGAKTIVAWHGGALAIGDLASGSAFELFYDGTNFRLMQPGVKQVGLRKVEQILASTTWTVPPGVYGVLIELWGAGGGSGAGNGTAQSGGGGAGGAYCSAYVAVVPGQTITITIGLAAAAATVGNSGSTGGTTSVVVGARTLTAPGGGGGQSGGTGALGGTPANASGGDINITGGQGGNYFSAAVGGRGGESPRGGAGSGSGNSGNFPGGGGGGGGPTNPGTIGGNGAVSLTY